MLWDSRTIHCNQGIPDSGLMLTISRALLSCVPPHMRRMTWSSMCPCGSHADWCLKSDVMVFPIHPYRASPGIRAGGCDAPPRSDRPAGATGSVHVHGSATPAGRGLPPRPHARAAAADLRREGPHRPAPPHEATTAHTDALGVRAGCAPQAAVLAARQLQRRRLVLRVTWRRHSSSVAVSWMSSTGHSLHYISKKLGCANKQVLFILDLPFSSFSP